MKALFASLLLVAADADGQKVMECVRYTSDRNTKQDRSVFGLAISADRSSVTYGRVSGNDGIGPGASTRRSLRECWSTDRSDCGTLWAANPHAGRLGGRLKEVSLTTAETHGTLARRAVRIPGVPHHGRPKELPAPARYIWQKLGLSRSRKPHGCGMEDLHVLSRERLPAAKRKDQEDALTAFSKLQERHASLVSLLGA